MPSLSRESDGAGDSGAMCIQYRRNPETDVYEERTPTGLNDIQLGWGVRVGSMTARSYSAQDWWQTTYVKEILEKDEKKIRFLTETGSVYTLED